MGRSRMALVSRLGSPVPYLLFAGFPSVNLSMAVYTDQFTPSWTRPRKRLLFEADTYMERKTLPLNEVGASSSTMFPSCAGLL